MPVGPRWVLPLQLILGCFLWPGTEGRWAGVPEGSARSAGAVPRSSRDYSVCACRDVKRWLATWRHHTVLRTQIPVGQLKALPARQRRAASPTGLAHPELWVWRLPVY